MKKFIVLTAAFALLSTPAFAVITGSSHDFNGSFGLTEICQPCHTPHNSASLADAPLWNHTLSVGPWTPYSGPGTLDATVGAPGTVSVLCLSCHDGTVAVDAYTGNAAPTNFIGAVPGNLGTDLSNDHPVGFNYTAALATTDGGLNNPASVDEVTVGGMPLFGSTGALECATCHDVHNGTGNLNMLYVDNTGSALCLTCHAK